MITLVTGATGFLGSALVRTLTKQPAVHVRVLARDVQKAERLFSGNVTIIQGDITEQTAVQQAVEGVNAIFHLAGRLYHPHVPTHLYYQTHVKGTQLLVDACRQQGELKHFVHCSTTGVYGITGPTPANEETPYAPTNAYETTKLESEQVACKAWSTWGLPLTIVRPGLVYGPGDLHLLAFFKAIKKGLFHVIDGGRALLHPVHIEDMTRAFLLCIAQEEPRGRSYNIAGSEPVTIRVLAEAIAQVLDTRLPTGTIPLWLANFAADLFTLLPGFQDERAPLTRSRVSFLTNSRAYAIKRAQLELGYQPTISLTTGIQQTASWYREQGYL